MTFRLCRVTLFPGNHTVDRQGHTRLSACLFGVFRPFRLGGRQPACASKTKNRTKIHRRQVLRSFVGAEMRPDKERPAGHTGVWPRDLTTYGRIYARQNRMFPCLSMVPSTDKGTHGFCRALYARHSMLGRNTPIRRQGPWPYDSMPCGPLLVRPHFCSDKTAWHLSIDGRFAARKPSRPVCPRAARICAARPAMGAKKACATAKNMV